MSDNPTLVRFFTGWKDDGVIGEDGLPQYREAIMIQLDRPPFLSIQREATDEDQDDFPDPWKIFQKEVKAREMIDMPKDGYPLVMWPGVNEFQLKMLAAHDIYTVQQLAKIGARKDAPAEFQDLGKAALKLLDLQKVAKFEPMIKDLEGQIEVLKEQVRDSMLTINAQKAEIDRLTVKGGRAA